MIARLGRLALFLVVFAGPASAQQPGPPPGAGRSQLEGEIRRGFTRAVRERVGLSEDQMRKLAPIAQQHEQERRRLQMDERQARLALQAAVLDSVPDQAKVSQLLDRLIDVQKRRVEILEREQKDLAAIMTPVQRARYMALQEQVRRRLEQMRMRRMMGPDAPRPGGPPPA